MKLAIRSIVHGATAAVLSLLVLFGTAHAQQQKCFPSKFGPKDEIGNANYITPEKTMQAVKTITRGKVYRARHRNQQGHSGFSPSYICVDHRAAGPGGRRLARPDQDHLQRRHHPGWVGIGSQIDGLGHIGIDDTLLQLQQGQGIRAGTEG